MPLIHDNPWLVAQLLKAAQEAAPTAPAPIPLQQQQQEVADALRALLQNLKAPTTSGVQHAGDSAVDLSAPHMASMGDFIEWLDTNKTKIDGVQIVYPGNGTRPSDDYGYFRIEPGTKAAVNIDDKNVHPTLPNRNEVRYWINTDALKKYLATLQADPKLKNKPTFQLQLLNLVRFANEQLDVGMNEQYKEELPDTTVVDSVPNPLDPEHWEASGQTPLTIKDIKSSEALGDWVEHFKIAVRKGNQTISSNDPRNFKLCDIVSALAQRAKGKMRTSATKAATDAYLKMITQIGSQSGCDMSGVQTQQQQQPGAGGQGQPGDMNTLQELAGEQIFDINSIDLDKIAIFADKYAGWANRPDINQLRDQIHNSVAKAKQLMAAPGIIQVTNMSRDEFRNLCKNGAAAKMLANTLTTVVSYGGRLVMDLANMIERGFRNGQAAARNLREQVAQGGPQQSNLTMLEQMSNLA